MVIIVLGSNGMAGHTIVDYLKRNTSHEIIDVARNNSSFDIDVERRLDDLSVLFENKNPSVVINCIGLLPSECELNPERAKFLNTTFPKWLEKKTINTPIKVIHLSTDCVYSGNLGLYLEEDKPDATNVYGLTKIAGEIVNDKDLTIRTSLIGREISEHKTGLLEWFLSQERSAFGYTNVMWSGVTTLELAKFIEYIINENIEMSGLLHLHSERTSKYNLLKMISSVWEKYIDIVAKDEPILDKSLISVRNDCDYKVPHLLRQITALYSWETQTKYTDFKKNDRVWKVIPFVDGFITKVPCDVSDISIEYNSIYLVGNDYGIDETIFDLKGRSKDNSKCYIVKRKDK